MPLAFIFSGTSRQLEQRQFPMPSPIGSEILVRVTCCSLCRSDLHTHAGRRFEPTPTILGHEIVGEIVAFGPSSGRLDANGVKLEIGTRVIWSVIVGCGKCFFCLDDLPQKCQQQFKYGHQKLAEDRPLGGGLCEFILLVERTAVYRIPDELPDTVAVIANCATSTVVALFQKAGVLKDKTVLILGGGILGLTASAMAWTAGARVVIVSDPILSSRERAYNFGATHVFTSDQNELSAHVKELTSGRGADIVFELAGTAQTVDTSINLARIGGVVVLAGTVLPVSEIRFNPENVVRRMLSIYGVHNYHPRDLWTALDFLAGLGRDFPWSKLITAKFPLEQTESAFETAHRQTGVRVAIRPSTYQQEKICPPRSLINS